ncbi:MAG: H-type small acid-soluble spore protein [Clostridiaceae bacterium]|jgi:small acid-soluble spore protein H (minor)|nr:H-type small acid-soluble spore protein [Clostridiaceae bacterium]
MDRRRAKAITASPVMTHVTYNGIPIYIENVDEISGVASIHPLDQPANRQRVPITSLVEH